MPSPEQRPLVAHVVYRFAVGGLENGVVNLINHLDPTRWRHAVVAMTEVDPAFARRVRHADVEFVALHKPPGHAYALYPGLWRLWRRLRPAIVHTRNLAALEAQLPAWLAGVPGRVHGEHGRDVDDLHGTSRRHLLARRLYKPFVQHTIALGQELSRYALDRVGIPAPRLHTIYNGVDTARFAPAASRAPIAGCPFGDPSLWLVGTVGRLQAVKAQPLLVRGFIGALRREPALRARLRLVLVGDGPLRAECEALLASAGMADLAWFAGERSDVPDVMRGLDCFVLPSLAEGISNTILEAMATGLPVIATQVGASAELVEQDQSGLLVPAGDAVAIEHALLALATDPARAARFGRVGRERAERRFSLPAMVAGYEGVYEQVLRQRTGE